MKGHFYGLQPRWLGSDRLYKVFVRRSSFCCARVAGQLISDVALD